MTLQFDLFDPPPVLSAPKPFDSTRNLEPHTKKPENVTVAPPPTSTRIVTLDGRDYRFHRDCGEFVWLAAPDAGIAGPFYWVRRSELPAVEDRAARLKAAQSRLSSVSKEHGAGAEYDAALAELCAVMKEG